MYVHIIMDYSEKLYIVYVKSSFSTTWSSLLMQNIYLDASLGFVMPHIEWLSFYKSKMKKVLK